MRVIRVASVASLFASVLVAQQTAPVAPRQDGRLKAEVHFTTDGSTWFTTNMPAYVALFDVSRTGVTQLYPTFSAQGQLPAGTFRDVALRYSAPLPGSAPLTPVSIAPTGANYSWPHTLLLVASTAPLRVGNPAESNISLYHHLFQEHHFTDVETPEGIKAIVALVSPLDSYAEVVTDQIASLPGSVRALASSAAYDPNRTAVGYTCFDGARTFFSVASQAGASCSAVRVVPPETPVSGFYSPTANGLAAMKVDTGAAKATNSTVSEKRNISDPAEIKRFMESLRNGNGAATSPGAARYVNSPSDRRAADVNRRTSDANGGARMMAQPGAPNGGQASRPAPPPRPPTTPSAPKTLAAPAPDASPGSGKKPTE